MYLGRLQNQEHTISNIIKLIKVQYLMALRLSSTEDSTLKESSMTISYSTPIPWSGTITMQQGISQRYEREPL